MYDYLVILVKLEGYTLVNLPFHKIALVEIGQGEAVFKYGEIVGYATAPIARGDWVHLHNLESAHFREGDAARSEAHG
jgi:altronate dehydratase small subunit